MTDLLEAIGQVRERPNTFLVQCSAHVQVHLVTERYHEEVFVIDTFIYPTKELGLLVRTDVERAQEPRHRLGDPRLSRPLAVGDDRRRAVQAGRRRQPARRPLRRRPDARPSRRGTSRSAAPRRVLRRGRHDLGRLRAAQALPRRRHRAARPLAVRRRVALHGVSLLARARRARARRIAPRELARQYQRGGVVLEVPVAEGQQRATWRVTAWTGRMARRLSARSKL